MHQYVSGQLSNDDLSWACADTMRANMKHGMDAHKELVHVANQMERGTSTKPAKHKEQSGAYDGVWCGLGAVWLYLCACAHALLHVHVSCGRALATRN